MPTPGRNNYVYNDLHHALKRKAKRLGLVCSWCKRPFDFDLPANDRMAFTYGHDVDISDGGDMRGSGHPLHRTCNAEEWRVKHSKRPPVAPPTTTRRW